MDNPSNLLQYLDALGVAVLSLWLYFKNDRKLQREARRRRQLYKAIHHAALGLKSAKDRGVNGAVDRALEEVAKIYSD